MNRLYIIPSIAAACVLPLSSCSHHPLSTQAMSFNKTVQQHRVEQLFINVLRASKREPMTITTVTNIGTTRTNRVALGPTSFAFGPAAVTGLFNTQATASAQDSPTMGLTILDDDSEFMEGFMAPVSTKRIKYFFDQNWRPQVLAYLLVEEFTTKNGNTYENDPRNRDEFEKFREIIDDIREIKFNPIKEAAQKKKIVTEFSGDPQFPNKIEKVFTEEKDASESYSISITDSVSNTTFFTSEITTRSPEGILYYLGELARLQLENGEYYGPEIEGEPIFKVVRFAELTSRPRVEVAFQGQVYAIPDYQGDRSMQSLSLVQQLINLQTKKITPPTNPIQLIGATL
ncbi:MAG: hypothetical protein P1V20_29725 [Verrucomicrobiales bacterium]|nr:hypothetical protein [Verrucomicrobiales bacterium]